MIDGRNCLLCVAGSLDHLDGYHDASKINNKRFGQLVFIEINVSRQTGNDRQTNRQTWSMDVEINDKRTRFFFVLCCLVVFR